MSTILKALKQLEEDANKAPAGTGSLQDEVLAATPPLRRATRLRWLLLPVLFVLGAAALWFRPAGVPEIASVQPVSASALEQTRIGQQGDRGHQDRQDRQDRQDPHDLQDRQAAVEREAPATIVFASPAPGTPAYPIAAKQAPARPRPSSAVVAEVAVVPTRSGAGLPSPVTSASTLPSKRIPQAIAAPTPRSASPPPSAPSAAKQPEASQRSAPPPAPRPAAAPRTSSAQARAEAPAPIAPAAKRVATPAPETASMPARPAPAPRTAKHPPRPPTPASATAPSPVAASRVAARPSLDGVTVARTVWHPVAARRTATLRVNGSRAEIEVAEGELFGALEVVEIRPSTVLFSKDGVVVERAVGSR